MLLKRVKKTTYLSIGNIWCVFHCLESSHYPHMIFHWAQIVMSCCLYKVVKQWMTNSIFLFTFKVKFMIKNISFDGNKNPSLWYLRESSWFDIFVSNNSALIDFPDGNKIPGCEKFSLCFGGRRQYCDTVYRDLGNLHLLILWWNKIIKIWSIKFVLITNLKFGCVVYCR